MFFLQQKDLPFKNRNEIKGIFKYHKILLLQWGQKEEGKIIDKFLGNLYIKTFKKLPKIKPIIIKKSNI